MFSFTIKASFLRISREGLHKTLFSYYFFSIFLQELLSGSPSRSSSSLSFQSTPPLQQSPASFSQPLLNGLGRSFSDGVAAVTQPNSSSLPTVSGLMASVAGIPQLNMNGVLSGLNGVIHSPLGNASQATLPTLRPQPPPLNPQALAQGFPFPKSVSPYVLKWQNYTSSFERLAANTPRHCCCLAFRSSLLSEQQKQLLLEQQQQLQQILTSQNFTHVTTISPPLLFLVWFIAALSKRNSQILSRNQTCRVCQLRQLQASTCF